MCSGVLIWISQKPSNFKVGWFNHRMYVVALLKVSYPSGYLL